MSGRTIPVIDNVTLTQSGGILRVNSGISTTHLADGGVTTAKLANAAVTRAKLGLPSINVPTGTRTSDGTIISHSVVGDGIGGNLFWVTGYVAIDGLSSGYASYKITVTFTGSSTTYHVGYVTSSINANHSFAICGYDGNTDTHTFAVTITTLGTGYSSTFNVYASAIIKGSY